MLRLGAIDVTAIGSSALGANALRPAARLVWGTVANTTKKTPEKEQAIIDALELHPSKSKACRSAKVRIDRSTLYRWMDEDLAFKARVDAAQEIGIDAVEDGMFEDATNHNTTAQIFALKSWRRERYGDRQAVDMNLTGSLTVKFTERTDGMP